MAIKIVVATHGNFGKEIIQSAGMLVGDISKITSLSLMPGMSFEDFVNDARDILTKNKDEQILCFVDLFGGTPSNTMTALTREFQMNVITGLNLPMLIDACLKIQSGETNLAKLTAEEHKAGQDSVVITNEKLEENNKNV